MVPLLPYIFAQRIHVEESRVQAYTSIFLFEGALVAIITSPLIGHVADRAKSKKALLLGMLMLTLASVCGLALTTSCTYVHLTTLVLIVLTSQREQWLGSLSVDSSSVSPATDSGLWGSQRWSRVWGVSTWARLQGLPQL